MRKLLLEDSLNLRPSQDFSDPSGEDSARGKEEGLVSESTEMSRTLKWSAGEKLVMYQ